MKKAKVTESYWNKVYHNSEIKDLGWYEEVSIPTINLLAETRIKKDDKILVVGAGTSKFVDWLIDKGYSRVIVNDISDHALGILGNRLGPAQNRIEWIVDDVTFPKELNKLKNIMLWQDRAFLHFLTDNGQRACYFKLINDIVAPGGYVLIGVFSKEGPEFCSGLPVVNYTSEMISEMIGLDFYLVESFNFLHYTPTGEKRPYIYTLFKRKNA